MQQKLNLKIKNRESFRPFAPIVREEDVSDWFDLDRPSPFMSIVAPVKGVDVSTTAGADDDRDASEVMDLSSWLGKVRSPIPAVTHVDGSQESRRSTPSDILSCICCSACSTS